MNWFVKKLVINYIAKEAQKMWDYLKGKKTYLISIANVIYNVAAAATGHITWQEAITAIFQSGLVSALRSGVANR